jgi:hypothetical protein
MCFVLFGDDEPDPFIQVTPFVPSPCLLDVLPHCGNVKIVEEFIAALVIGLGLGYFAQLGADYVRYKERVRRWI